MLNFLNIDATTPVVTACLDKALGHYVSGDKRQLRAAATTALKASVRLRDDLGTACALTFLAASGSKYSRYLLAWAAREMWHVGGAGINRGIVSLALARAHEKAGKRGRAIAEYQRALEHCARAKRHASARGDLDGFKGAQKVESLAGELAGGAICTL